MQRVYNAPTPEAACAGLVAGGRWFANALVAAYRQTMLEAGLSPATINRRICTLLCIVRLARRYDLCDWSLEVDSLPAQSYRDTRGPGRVGWQRLEAQARKEAYGHFGTNEGKRNYAMLRLLYDLALRRSELVALDVEHYDAAGGRVWVLGKGRLEREALDTNAAVGDALERWLEVRGRDPGPLFYRMDHRAKWDGNGGRQRLSDDAVWQWVKSLAKRAGIKGPVRPHGIRHQALTRCAELSNGNVLMVQQLARHKDPKTSQIYLDNLNALQGKATSLLGGDV
jgi:integrase/recombinase XerC